ncbi:MAG: phosphoglycerate mutase [Rhodanobacter sp.]|nr:MAG: phosphoglycerate mutase [Rhodanobacter sp.]
MGAQPTLPLQVWLPGLASFAAGHPLQQWLARADRLDQGAHGYMAGLAGYFEPLETPFAAAALTRDFLTGDAGDDNWLAADPAWVQPDLTGVRLLACGHLGLQMDEALNLAEPLRPLFGEAGMQLEISTPDRWHVRLPGDASWPDFAAPEQALGEDLSQHLPQGVEGRRWRVLLNEIQVVLHQHPRNAQRRAAGLAPVNSLWLWGGGCLPQRLHSPRHGVVADDLLLNAMASRAGLARRPRTAENVSAAGPGWLVDLQDLPAGAIEADWWPTLQALLSRRPVELHFASAERWQCRPWHRWRVWRGAGH